MRGVAVTLMLMACAAALVGCKPDEQSRVYEAELDVTWAAAIRVVRSLTSAEPSVADESRRRIVTEWIAVSGDGVQGPAGAVSGTDFVRGVIYLKRVESGTRVSIRTDREFQTVDVSPGRSTEPETVGIFTQAPPRGLQQSFLDRLSVELAEGEATGEQPESGAP